MFLSSFLLYLLMSTVVLAESFNETRSRLISKVSVHAGGCQRWPDLPAPK